MIVLSMHKGSYILLLIAVSVQLSPLTLLTLHSAICLYNAAPVPLARVSVAVRPASDSGGVLGVAVGSGEAF